MIFISGTDTGCGKTTVGRAILSAFRARGMSVAPLKPIETGCIEDGSGQLRGADADALARAAGCELPHSVVCPNRLVLPASPERAAKAEGVRLDTRTIADSWERIRSSSDFAIVEGAGGLLVPITETMMMIELPSLLSVPVVLVARDALGTVNHPLLSVEAIRARSLPLVGVIFSATEDDAEGLENTQAIEAHGRVRILGRLPHLPDATDRALAEAAEKHLDLAALIECCT